jgi:hypothetical protein
MHCKHDLESPEIHQRIDVELGKHKLILGLKKQ